MWPKFLAWRGVLAIGVLAVVSLWLAFEGRLGFYIHPRYNLFTVSMAVIAVGLLVIAVVTRGEKHDHDDDSPAPRRRRIKPLEVASLAITTLLVGAVLLLPPATLSSATAENRSSNEIDALGSPLDLEGELSQEIFETLTVRDWASLFTQNQNPAFYRGKPVNAIGIVSASSQSADVFLLTRFVVTCCAVDAQPVSIPVYLPGWQQDVSVNGWVRVRGGFQPSPSGVTDAPVVVVPLELSEEEVPREPYLF